MHRLKRNIRIYSLFLFTVLFYSSLFTGTAHAGWSFQNPPLSDAPINDVLRISASNIFSVGKNGTILRYDGTTTTVMNSGTSKELYSLWGTVANDIYAAGNGVLLHYNGTVWSRVDTGFSDSFYAIWKASSGEIFLGGAGRIIYSDSTGANWKEAVNPSGFTSYGCLDISGSSASDVYCPSSAGYIFHFDGSAITSLRTGSSSLNSVWVKSATSIYFAGDSGKIFHYDGTTFTDYSTGSAAFCHIGGNTTEVVAITTSGQFYSLSGGTFGSTGVTGNIPTLMYAATGNTIAEVVAGDYYSDLYTLDIFGAWTKVTPSSINSVGYIDVWGSSATDILAMTPNGVGAAHYNGTMWSTAGFSGLTGVYGIRSVMGSLPTDVWAVGDYGQIFHSTDSLAWTSDHLVTPSNGINGFTQTATGKFLAVGVGGEIWEFNPSNNGWTRGPAIASETRALNAVWDTGFEAGNGTDIFAVGNSVTNPVIRRYTLGGWETTTMGNTATSNLFGVWGDANNNVYAVGLSGTVIHYDSFSWTAVNLGFTTATHLYAVWGANGKVFAVGASGVVLYFDGTIWTKFTNVDTGVSTTLNHVWGTSETDVWAVGASGKITHWDGTSWTAYASGTTAALNYVWGTSSTDIYATGDGGIITHWNGATWSSITQKMNGYVTNWKFVGGSSPTDIQIVDYNAAMNNFSGSAWSQGSAGRYPNLKDVYAFDTNNAWAVGDGGTILKWNGSTWTRQISFTYANLTSVYAVDANNAIVVGDKIVLKTTNGGGFWMPIDVTNSFTAVWGTSLSNLWALDGTGTVYRSTDGGGATWSGTAVPGATTLKSIWGTGTGDVFVTGLYGNFHFNGTVWTKMDTGTTTASSAIWGTGSLDTNAKANKVYAVGGNGDILFFDGDTVAPVTYATPAGGSYGTISVNFTCEDYRGIGCAETLYSTSGTPTTVYSNTGIDLASTTTLSFKSKDGHGNSETAKSESYDVDGTAPTTTVVVDGTTFDGGGGGTSYVSLGATLTLACDDGDGSGCANTYYAAGSWNDPEMTDTYLYTTGTVINVSDIGSYGVKFFSVDARGNQESLQTVYFSVDYNAPTSSLSPDNYGTNYSPYTFSISCNDYESGCAATYYTLDGSTATTASTLFTSDITISSETTISFFSVDNAGNQEFPQTRTFYFSSGGDGGGCGGPGQPGCDNGGGDDGGCFIATAAYGSYLDPHVETLRNFRDTVLLNSEAGRAFVDLYYTYSPYVADFIAESPMLRSTVRAGLAPMVYALEYPKHAGLLSLVLAFSFGTIAWRRGN